MKTLIILLVALAALNSAELRAEKIDVSAKAAREIGQLIWQNECAGTERGLTSWNTGENFASLGIGHFIWYPRGVKGPFQESFPELVRFMQERGAKVPKNLEKALGSGCPWPDRKTFLAKVDSPEMVELRSFLVATVPLQAEFLVRRFELAVPKIIAAAPKAEQATIQGRLQDVASTPRGIYALVDYTNFKGEGISPSERYQGQGWGLLQVLQSMKGSQPANKDFAEAARRVLAQRVANSPAARNEQRWMQGWSNRVRTYGGS